MITKFKLAFLLNVLILPLTFLQAQDPSFSQFYAVRSYLNPAMVGIQKGITINMAYRNQWFNVPGGFDTYYGAIEFQEPNLNSAFGFSVFHNAEGQASIVTERVAFNYNYFLTPNIQIGLEPSVTRKFLDWGKYIFSDQLDPIFGVSKTSIAVPILDKVYAFDVGGGITYRGDLGRNAYGRYIFGVSAHHLWPWREESLQNFTALTPSRLTVHGGIELPLISHNSGSVHAQTITWLPSFKYDWHKPFQILTFGCHVVYQNAIYVGLFNQHRFLIDNKNTNAFSFLLGYKFPIGRDQQVDLGINYDANGTGLSLRSGGVVELTMNVNFGQATLFSQGSYARRRKGLLGRGGSLGGSTGGKSPLNCKSFF